jgi:putative ABC transport system permease protein
MNLWSLAFRNVARNRRRSILTGGVVVFGFASFALAGGFAAQNLQGLRDATIRSGMGHIQFARPEVFDLSDTGTLQYGIEDAAAKVRELARDSDVIEVLKRIDFMGLITNGEASIPFLGVGVEPQAEARTMDQPSLVSSGRWLEDRNERGVVLGSGLARALSVSPGDSITLLATTSDGTLNALDALVVGVSNLPIKQLNDRYLATSLALAAELLVAEGRLSKLVVVLEDDTDATVVRDRLAGRLHELDSSLVGKTWEELAVFYSQVRLLYAAIFGFMGAVLVIVVLLAAANTMMMAATERTREIGTLRALGTRPRTVRLLFIAEGLILAVLGCGVGALLSLAVRLVLNNSGIMLPPPPGGTVGSPLHVQFFGVTYAAGAAAMVFTMAAASYFPARRASRISVVKALTHV